MPPVACWASSAPVTRRLASERGVRVAKWLGDGCMVVAIDQEDMIAFALDLEREATVACDPLSLRIGVATGRALLFEGDDYIGSAVNLAARLCDAAGPGEVLVPAEQAVDLPEGVTATPHGVIELHGFPQPVTVANLAGTPMVRGRNDTGELWTRSPFLALTVPGDRVAQDSAPVRR